VDGIRFCDEPDVIEVDGEEFKLTSSSSDWEPRGGENTPEDEANEKWPFPGLAPWEYTRQEMYELSLAEPPRPTPVSEDALWQSDFAERRPKAHDGRKVRFVAPRAEKATHGKVARNARLDKRDEAYELARAVLQEARANPFSVLASADAEEEDDDEPLVITPAQSVATPKQRAYEARKKKASDQKAALTVAKRSLRGEARNARVKAGRRSVPTPTLLPDPLPVVSKEEAAKPVGQSPPEPGLGGASSDGVRAAAIDITTSDGRARLRDALARGGPVSEGVAARLPTVRTGGGDSLEDEDEKEYDGTTLLVPWSAPCNGASKNIGNTAVPTQVGYSHTPALVWPTDGPNSMLTNHEGRKLSVEFDWYTVPRLSDLGVVGVHGLPIVGMHMYMEDGTQRVRLPKPLVTALGSYWAHKDFSAEEFLVSVEHCAALCRRISFLDPSDEETARLWGPVVGYALTAVERSRAGAVLRGKAVTKALMRLSAFAVPVAILSGLPVACALPVAAPVAAVVGSAISIAAVTTTIAGLLWWAGKGALALARVREEVSPLMGALAPAHIVDRPREGAYKGRKRWYDRDDEFTKPEAMCTGFAIRGYEPRVFTSNAWNESVALDKRGMEGGPPLNGDRAGDWLDFIQTEALGLFGNPSSICMPHGAALARWNRQCIDECNSSPMLKAAMRARLDELEAVGESCHSVFSGPVLRRINRTKMMIKLETTVKRNSVIVYDDVESKPRQIMCSGPDNTVLTMPAVKRLQGLLRHRWHPKNWLVYAPGADLDKIAAEIGMRRPVKANNKDFGNFDATRADIFLQGFLWWCKRHGCPRGTLDIIAQSGTVTGESRWGWEFEFHELLGSGRAWTTLFNTWLNGTLNAYMYCRGMGKTVAEASRAFTHISAGDDGLSLHAVECDLDWASMAAELGFVLESEDVREFRDYQFCSMRLFHTSKGLEWVDMPGRVIAKLGWSVRARTPKMAREIARGSALSFLPRCRALPMLRAVLEAVEVQTRGEEARMPDSEPWRPKKSMGGEPTTATWNDMYCVYGWTQQHQLILEKWLDGARIGEVHDQPLLRMLCDVDTGGQKRWIDEHVLSTVEPISTTAVGYCEPPKNDTLICTEDMHVEAHLIAAAMEMHETWEEKKEEPAQYAFPVPPTIQVIVKLPEQAARVVELEAGSTLSTLRRAVGLESIAADLTVVLDGRPAGPDAVLDDGAAVWFSLRLLGGVKINSVVQMAQRIVRRASSAKGARKRTGSRKRASTPAPRRRRPKVIGNGRATRGERAQMVRGQDGPAVAPSISVPAPRMPNAGRKGGEGRMFSDSGEDFWQNISAGTYTAGQVMLTTPITIAQMGTWLKTILQLYEKWQIARLIMKYRPSVGSTQPGNIVMFFDPDPTNNWAGYTPGADLVKRAFNMAGRTDFALWQACQASSPPTGWLWTQPQGSDPRLFQGGQFVVVCVTGFTSSNDIGALYMDWAVNACIKTYNQAAFTMTTMTVASSGTIDARNSDFAGRLLTPPLYNSSPTTNPSSWIFNMGAPIAVLPQDMPSVNMIDSTLTTRATASVGNICLPAGEYLVTVNAQGNYTGIVPSVVLGNVFPCAQDGTWIKAVDVGPTLLGGSSVKSGIEATYIVEIPDDVDMLALPIDVSNSTTTAVQNGSSKVGRTNEESSDWGIVDTFFNWVGLGANAVEVGMEIVEIVASIAGLLFFAHGPNRSPNCRAHHTTRHGLKVWKFSNQVGLSMGKEELGLLQEFLTYKKRLALDEWTDGQGTVAHDVAVVQESDDEPHSPKSEKQVVAPVQKKALAKSPGLPLMRRASFQY
jgi:hypothetical protein